MRIGKLCGAFLIDDAFETWMQNRSGLRFSQCHAPKNDFRIFVNEEWEYTMKRAFTGKETNKEFILRPPAKAFSKFKRVRGQSDSYSIKGYVSVTLHLQKQAFMSLRSFLER